MDASHEPTHQQRIIHVGTVPIELSGPVVLVAGRPIELAPRERAVLEVMDREPQTVSVDMPLEAVLRHLQSRPLQPILVIGQEAGTTGLVGMITLDNLGELIQISQTMKQA